MSAKRWMRISDPERRLLSGKWRGYFSKPQCAHRIYLELDQVEDIIAHNQDVVVIVDEAYVTLQAGRPWN